MVRPLHFDSNTQTAETNKFQLQGSDAPNQQVVKMVVHEFNHFVRKLSSIGITVVVFDDIADTPDAVFSNNWLSTHDDGRLITYPMQAPNRRAERRSDIIAYLQTHFVVGENLALHNHLEHLGQYLEGTGSLVLDRINKIAYACRSERTHTAALSLWSKHTGYRTFVFDAYDQYQQAVYHTNVVLSVGEGFAVVCLEAISNGNEQQQLVQLLTETEHTIVDISMQQMHHFAANILQVSNNLGELVLVMSEQAYLALHQEQLIVLNQYHEHLLHTPLYNIEKYGGGSARCMLTEVFLPPISSPTAPTND